MKWFVQILAVLVICSFAPGDVNLHTVQDSLRDAQWWANRTTHGHVVLTSAEEIGLVTIQLGIRLDTGGYAYQGDTITEGIWYFPFGGTMSLNDGRVIEANDLFVMGFESRPNESTALHWYETDPVTGVSRCRVECDDDSYACCYEGVPHENGDRRVLCKCFPSSGEQYNCEVGGQGSDACEFELE